MTCDLPNCAASELNAAGESIKNSLAVSESPQWLSLWCQYCQWIPFLALKCKKCPALRAHLILWIFQCLCHPTFGVFLPDLLPEGAVTFPILQVFWEQHRWWALSFCNLTPTKESWFPTLFWIKEEDVVFFFHRTHICLSQGKHRLQCLWFPVTKKLSVVCVCVSVSWILMSHVNSTFVTNFTVIDHLHHVWIITSPNRIPNVMTTLMAPSNWFTCVTVAASCCIVLQRLSD